MKKLYKCEKNNLIVMFLLFLMILNSIFALPKIVSAGELTISDSQIIEQGYGLYKIDDENLYNALWEKCQSLDPSAQHLTAGIFKNLQNLDLSECNINSINGLHYFNFNNLKVLDISNNEITTRVADFSNIPLLETLNAKNNNIDYLDASTFQNLINLDISNNELVYANISTLAEGGIANLSNNYLNDFSKLVLPNNNANIFLTHNLLIDDLPQVNCTLYMGFQGVKNSGNLTKFSSILYYGLDGVEDVRIYKIEEQEVLVYTLDNGDSLTNLSIGNYLIRFTETGTKYYNDITFTIRPPKPVVKIMNLSGEVATEPYILNYESVVNITADEGEVYYSINNGQSIKGSELKIKSGGSYTIRCWQVIDGMESESVTVLVIYKKSNPLMLVWLLVGTLAIAAIFYAGVIWRDNIGKKKSSSKNSNKGFK